MSEDRRQLSPKEVSAELGITTRTLRKWVSEGRWPQPIRYSARSVRWRRGQVDEAAEELRRRDGLERKRA
jgi:predicted DNA-binding transcriptional regulator AlpA